jgi:hypothetical protein
MANSWRWAVFFLPISFWELPNNEIWETKNEKLLELLLEAET